MLARPIAVVFLGAVALAGGVGNVSRSPVVVHADLQTAIDAAGDGDVLLVHGGTYSGFTIDNRSIAIVAVPGETVRVQGNVELKNVPSSKRVVLSNLEVDASLATHSGNPAVSVEACDGTIWLQSCVLVGGNGAPGTAQSDGGFGGDGARVEDSQSVVLIGSTLRGGVGGGHPFQACLPCFFAGPGGTGLFVKGASRVALYDSDAFGGKGGGGGFESGSGGAGVLAYDAEPQLFAAKSTATGGDGGQGGGSADGDGGAGIQAPSSPTIATVLDCGFLGGNASGGAQSGAPIFGSVRQLAASARTFATASVVRDASGVDATFTGATGDSCFAPSSMSTDWSLKLAANGVWVLRYPTKMSKTPLAVVPASGTAAASWNASQLANGVQAQLQFHQGFVLPADGGAVLASPACTLVLDAQALPDCDANGVFDVVDIVEGAGDFNCDFEPDVCTTQLVWYVDDDAPSGGDGSLGAPFNTIQQGLDACLPGRIVEVLDGTYGGIANRNLDFGGKSLTLRSRNGAASCAIDCAGLGRAFHLHSGEGTGTRIQGFTVRNGFRDWSANDPDGGALLIENGAGVAVVGCRFENNFADRNGGAIAIRNGAGVVRIDGCDFFDNSTSQDPGLTGGGAIYGAASTSILRCTFGRNAGLRGGAILMRGSFGLDLTHSNFFENTADYFGGAVSAEVNGSSTTASLRASNLLFAGNVAQRGGGAISTETPHVSSTVQVELVNSTFVSNASVSTFAAYGGGALSFVNANAELTDCLLWQNSSGGTGDQILLGSGSLDVSFCDVEGGAAGVGGTGGALNWGAGNLSADPGFVDPDGADGNPTTFGDNVYRLKPTSPCLDAGDSIHALADVTDIDGDLDFGELVPLDLNLKPRFKDLPSVPDTGVGSPPIDLGCFERQN